MTFDDPWWDYACAAANALSKGLPPPIISVHGPVLDSDEQPRLTAPAQISRLVAGDGSYQRSTAMLLGSPMLTLSVLGAQGILNFRRRQRAHRDTIPTWRLHRLGTVLITDQRLICPAADGTELLSFWFTNATEYHPNVAQRTLELAFSTVECEPLRLGGPAVPALALWTAVAIYGHDWINDDRLHPLLGSPQAAFGCAYGTDLTIAYSR
jgi:hypothetical protein